jgi:hypothetical protein
MQMLRGRPQQGIHATDGLVLQEQQRGRSQKEHKTHLNSPGRLKGGVWLLLATSWVVSCSAVAMTAMVVAPQQASGGMASAPLDEKI